MITRLKITKPAILFLLCSLAITVLSCLSCRAAFAGDMNDISGHWAAVEIKKAVAIGYIKPYADGTFKPNAEVASADFVSMLAHAFPDDEYEEEIAEVASMSGFSNKTFPPQEAIDRQQAACLLAKLLKLGGGADLSFSDAGQIDSWAKPFVSRVVGRGIMGGLSDNMFKPKKNISRAEAVAVINRAIAARSVTATSVQLQVVDSVVNVRSGPGKNEPIIGQVNSGSRLQATARSGDNWYKVNYRGGTGWIAGWCVRTVQPSQPEESRATKSNSRGSASDVIDFAKRYLGRPYVYGGNGPGSFDCSGLVCYVYSHFGIDLPRVADDQAKAGEKVSSPSAGDLVFFSGRNDGYITHVGIYIGNDSFIHASTQGVAISSLESSWYKSHYVKACRVM